MPGTTHSMMGGGGEYSAAAAAAAAAAADQSARALLGVGEDALVAATNRAWRRAARRYHPDKHMRAGEEARARAAAQYAALWSAWQRLVTVPVDAARGVSVAYVVRIPLRELAERTPRRISVSRRMVVGREGGEIVAPRDLLRGGGAVQACDACAGPGVAPHAAACPKCLGRRLVLRPERFEFKTVVTEHVLPVDAATTNGTKWVLSGEGSMSPGLVPGDVVCVARVHHPAYLLKACHLIEAKPRVVSFAAAVAGFQAPLYNHPTGNRISVSMAPGALLAHLWDDGGPPSSPLTPVRAVVRGMGLHGQGDLHARFVVRPPPATAEGVRELARALRRRRCPGRKEDARGTTSDASDASDAAPGNSGDDDAAPGNSGGDDTGTPGNNNNARGNSGDDDDAPGSHHDHEWVVIRKSPVRPLPTPSSPPRLGDPAAAPDRGPPTAPSVRRAQCAQQ